ncbi:MAG: hypothetical protein LUH02_01750 [Erysipelotrichaceae bacterium]|nr:hypothetical protein [Erysipelotrichaceae bacterium]
MKKIMICLLLSMALIGCQSNNETENNETTTQNDTTDTSTETTNTQTIDAYDSIIEEAKDSTYNLGYLLKDIDNNGIDELILGEYPSDDDSSWNEVIYDIYTIDNNEIIHVAEGGERNRYYLCDNGLIANECADSASYSTNAYYIYSDNSLTLSEAIIYNSEASIESPWFYTTTDLNDWSQNISEDEALEIMSSYTYIQLELEKI